MMKPVKCEDCRFASMMKDKVLFCERMGVWKTSFNRIYCYLFEPKTITQKEVI
jgi:hypothetical protein